MRSVLPALLAAAAAIVATSSTASAACDVAALKLEETISQKKELQQSANQQVVQDLRTLRDAAIVLKAFKYEAECEQLLAIVKTLTADPDRAVKQSGDTDEEQAEEIEEERAPKVPAGLK